MMTLTNDAVLVIAGGILIFWISFLIWNSRRWVNSAMGKDRYKIKLFVSYYFDRPSVWHDFVIYDYSVTKALEQCAEKLNLKDWVIGEIMDQGDHSFLINIFVRLD